MLISGVFLLILMQLGAPAPDSLRDLVRVALEENRDIQAAARRWEAAAARPSQARALPNPTVSFTYRNAGSPFPGTSVGEDPLSFVAPMVMQRLPFPGKLGLRGEIAETEADTEGRLYDAVRLRVVADLKRAYFDLYHVERSIETVERSRELIGRFVSVARSRYEVGSGIQQDVLRAQVEETLLEDRLTVLGQRAGQRAARINELLHRPPSTPVRAFAEMSPSPLEYTAEQLYAVAEEANPRLDSRRLQIDRSARVLELARKAHLPDFDIKVGRMFMGSFDDMWDVSISAEIPLFFWQKERRGVEEASVMLRESRNEFEAAGQALYREITDHYLAAQSTERLERLYREAVIPQASLTLESSLAAYRVGDLDFLGVLENWSTLLDFEVEYYAQVSEHEKALASLEELTGLELVQPGGSE
jgi:outer membrane protein TolC